MVSPTLPPSWPVPLRIGREGSAVIGIEGAWGTGKTSLLNLLRTALDKQQEARTFVLTISPGSTAVIRLWWRPYCFRSPPSLPRKKNAGFQRRNGRHSEGKSADRHRPNADGLHPGNRPESGTCRSDRRGHFRRPQCQRRTERRGRLALAERKEKPRPACATRLPEKSRNWI